MAVMEKEESCERQKISVQISKAMEEKECIDNEAIEEEETVIISNDFIQGKGNQF